MAQSQIAELLQKVGLLDERQVDAVMSRASSHAGGYVVLQVADLGYASESSVARAISIELGLPRIDLSITPPEPDALAILDGRACVDRFVLPVALRENGELLWLAMADPTDTEAIAFVRRKSGKRVRPAVAGPSEITRAVKKHYKVAPSRISGARGEEDLGSIDISEISGEQERIEVVNVMDESASPLARIAKQLGVEVPLKTTGENSPVAIEVDAGDHTMVDAPAIESAHLSRPPRPKPPVAKKPTPPPPADLEVIEDLEPVEVTAPGTGPDELGAEQMATLEAVRASMEKGAHVLSAVVKLCVEKGVFTKEEMAARRRKEG